MTKWLLECKACGTRRVIDVGYNLREFKQLYIYCRSCERTQPHAVLSVIEGDRTSAQSPP